MKEKTTGMNRAFCAVLAIMFTLAFVPTYALADTTTSGTWGTCAWDITDGVLTIHEGTGSNPTSDFDGPWTGHISQITEVRTEGAVIFPKNCSNLFVNLYKVVSMDLCSADTSNTTNMYCMFEGCTNLASLNISNFDTANVTRMDAMFNSCSSLTSLDLSSFDTSNVTNMKGMFYGCSKLETICVSALWNTDKVSNSQNMFKSCTKLTGGNGTRFSSAAVDIARAVADTPENPGYLTLKIVKSVDPSQRSSNITIETEASTINVTVPTNAAFVFKADGSNVYPSNYEVTNNNGLTAITLDAIDFKGINGWSLTDEEDTFQADVKKFALKMGLKDSALSVVDKDNGVSFAGDTEIKIAPQSSKVLGFEAVRGVFSEPVTTESAMQMTMHFDWEHAA